MSKAQIKTSKRLDRLRQKIDKVDRAILKSFAKRFAIVEQIGLEKSKLGLGAFQRGRSQVVFKSLSAAAKKVGLDPVLVKSVYNSVLRASVKKQVEVIRSQTKRKKR